MFEPLLRITFGYSTAFIIAETLADISPVAGLWGGFFAVMGTFLWESMQ